MLCFGRIKYLHNIIKLASLGSNPMHPEAMEHVRSLGVTVFMDVQHTDIKERLTRMKVSVSLVFTLKSIMILGKKVL